MSPVVPVLFAFTMLKVLVPPMKIGFARVPMPSRAWSTIERVAPLAFNDPPLCWTDPLEAVTFTVALPVGVPLPPVALMLALEVNMPVADRFNVAERPIDAVAPVTLTGCTTDRLPVTPMLTATSPVAPEYCVRVNPLNPPALPIS